MSYCTSWISDSDLVAVWGPGFGDDWLEILSDEANTRDSRIEAVNKYLMEFHPHLKAVDCRETDGDDLEWVFEVVSV